jgi:drug/metabolite transporter (DMT)-like permease
MNRTDLAAGTLVMIGVVLIWGTFLPVSKVALHAIDPYYLTALRYGAAALAFVALVARFEGRSALRTDGHGLALFLYGSCGFAGFSILVYEGLKLTRPEHGAMILALVPVWIAFWQWLRTGHRPPSWTLVCIAIALAGEALVVSGGDPRRLLDGGDQLGNLLVLASSICWTAYTLGTQRVPRWSPLRYTALSASLGWPAIAAITAVATAIGHSGPPAMPALAGVGWELAYIVVVVSFGAMLLWNTGVRKLGPLNAALFANFAPVVTYAIAAAQGQAIAAAEIAGATLVIAALVANNLFNRRALARAEKTLLAARSRA